MSGRILTNEPSCLENHAVVPSSASAWLDHGLRKKNTESHSLRTTIFRCFVEPLDQLASVRLDHPPGGKVVRITRQLYVGKPLTSCLRKQQLQGASSVSPLPFPRDH